MNKKQLMRFITEVSFAMDDIALYLDLHPSCKHALSKDYISLYGPLNKYQVNDDNYFTWVNDPWPWEREGNC